MISKNRKYIFKYFEYYLTFFTYYNMHIKYIGGGFIIFDRTDNYL